MKFAVILEIYITKAAVITNDSPQNWEMGSDSIYCGCGIIRTMQGFLPNFELSSLNEHTFNLDLIVIGLLCRNGITCHMGVKSRLAIFF